MFQRSDCYAETFTLNPCRSDKYGIAWDDFLRNRHRLQKPQPDSLPVRHALCPIDTCRYGVLVRYRTASHCRMETHVALLCIHGGKFRIAHRLCKGGNHLSGNLLDRHCRMLFRLPYRRCLCCLLSVLTAQIFGCQFIRLFHKHHLLVHRGTFFLLPFKFRFQRGYALHQLLHFSTVSRRLLIEVAECGVQVTVGGGRRPDCLRSRR